MPSKLEKWGHLGTFVPAHTTNPYKKLKNKQTVETAKTHLPAYLAKLTIYSFPYARENAHTVVPMSPRPHLSPVKAQTSK